MSARVLIDASNLHSGGGVQVAASFINELLRSSHHPHWLPTAAIRVSSQVWEDLAIPAQPRVEILDATPGPHFLVPRRPEYDVAFRVFGPHYGPREGRVEIAGLADPYVPPGWASEVKSPSKPKSVVKLAIKRRRMRSYDQLWVESEAFADSLSTLSIPRDRVAVVPNVASSEIRSGGTTVGLAWRAREPLRLLYPARPYPHKNHAILGEVGSALAARGVDVQFDLTVAPEEWTAFPELVRKYTRPLGILTQVGLLKAYTQVHGIVFPTLMEVSSATPLEAMALGLPLFASDRPFVTEQSQDAAWYFEPRDPGSVADAIAGAATNPRGRARRVSRGLEITAATLDPQDRLEAFASLIEAALQGGHRRSPASKCTGRSRG